MQEFFEVYDRHELQQGFRLEIYHSSIMDYTLEIGFKSTSRKADEPPIITIQCNDYKLLFSKAHVLLCEWLLENNEGY